MTVSLHAFTEKTYNKIVKYGNYKKVIENIEYISKLKKEGKIERFELHFTVTSLNYKEIPEMIKYCRKIDAKIRLLGLDCSLGCEETYKKINIQDKTHPLYNSLVKTFQQRTIKESNDVVIQGLEYFTGLKPISKIESLKNKLFSVMKSNSV